MWRNIEAGIDHCTDTFFFDDSGKIALQTVTFWTQEGKPVNTGESFELSATVPDTEAQAHWDNHLDAFGTGDIEKMVLDYVDNAEIIEYDVATDTQSDYKGTAGVRGLFPKYFGWAGKCGTNMDVDLPIIRTTATYVYITVTWNCHGIPSWTDTFALNSEGMITKQNIVYLQNEVPVFDTDADGAASVTASLIVGAVATAVAMQL